jgi:hypothetical protein
LRGWWKKRAPIRPGLTALAWAPDRKAALRSHYGGRQKRRLVRAGALDEAAALSPDVPNSNRSARGHVRLSR